MPARSWCYTFMAGRYELFTGFATKALIKAGEGGDCTSSLKRNGFEDVRDMDISWKKDSRAKSGGHLAIYIHETSLAALFIMDDHPLVSMAARYCLKN